MMTAIRSVQIPVLPEFQLDLPVGSEFLCVRHFNGAPHLYYRCDVNASEAPHSFGSVLLNCVLPPHLARAPYIDTYAYFEHDTPKTLLGGLLA